MCVVMLFVEKKKKKKKLHAPSYLSKFPCAPAM